jgi:hypothetical protein
MQELQVVSSINMDILIAEGASLKQSKKTKDNTTMKYFGLQSLFFSSELCLQRTHGLMMIFLPIRKKSICAGGLNKGYTIKYNYKSTVYHVEHYKQVIKEIHY